MHEEIESEEEKGRDADIGRNIVSVGDGIGIEDEQRRGDEPGQSTAEFASPEEEEETEEERDECDRQSGPEEDRVAVIAGDIRSGAVHEEVPERPLLVDTVLPLGRIQRELHIEKQEWETSQIFEEWWMLRIEPHIAVSDIAVGGGDVSFFVESC